MNTQKNSVSFLFIILGFDLDKLKNGSNPDLRKNFKYVMDHIAK